MKMCNEFLKFGALEIERPEIDKMLAFMESGKLRLGPKVSQLGQDFSLCKGSKHVGVLTFPLVFTDKYHAL